MVVIIHFTAQSYYKFSVFSNNWIKNYYSFDFYGFGCLSKPLYNAICNLTGEIVLLKNTYFVK